MKCGKASKWGSGHRQLSVPLPTQKMGSGERLTLSHCHASFLLGESRQCHRAEACLLCLLPLGTELHRTGSSNSPFFLASKLYFRTAVGAIAVLRYSELAFTFFLFVANVALDLACLENGCNKCKNVSTVDTKDSRYKGSVLWHLDFLNIRV